MRATVGGATLVEPHPRHKPVHRRGELHPQLHRQESEATAFAGVADPKIVHGLVDGHTVDTAAVVNDHE